MKETSLVLDLFSIFSYVIYRFEQDRHRSRYCLFITFCRRIYKNKRVRSDDDFDKEVKVGCYRRLDSVDWELFTIGVGGFVHGISKVSCIIFDCTGYWIDGSLVV